jgi:hypothetical protein
VNLKNEYGRVIVEQAKKTKYEVFIGKNKCFEITERKRGKNPERKI